MKDIILNFKQNKKIILLNFLLLVICVLIDQISKQFMVSFLEDKPYNSFYIMPFFNFTLAFNTGVSFSMFAEIKNGKFILSGFAILISLFLTYLFLKEKKAILLTSYALIIAGAIGNTIDRLSFGFVIDFLHFHINDWHYPIFNIADCLIFVGAFTLIFVDIFKKKHEA
jgi:signal peptidase II